MLRIGVALLGLRITVEQIAAMGWQPVLLVVVSVVLTIVVSVAAARLCGFKGLFGLLTGGATAICGASAALALAAALPGASAQGARDAVHRHRRQRVVDARDDPLPDGRARARTRRRRRPASSSAARSTTWRRWSAPATACRARPGDAATFVKLMRVAMLLPVIVCAVMITRLGIGRTGGAAGEFEVARPGARPPLLPWFAVAFAALVAVNSTGWIPQPVLAVGNDALALVPGRGDRRDRHEDPVEGALDGRHQAGRC